MQKTHFIPMFPLNIVVFPGERLNLHIFEPRYKQLIADCEKQNIPFGIAPYINNQLMEIGTKVRLVKIEKRYDDGKMDVRTEGVSLFKVVDFYSQAIGKMYGAADVIDLSTDDTVGIFMKNEQLIALLTELFQLMRIQKTVSGDAFLFRTYDFAHYVGFNIEQEYEFLRLKSEEDRQDYMMGHLEKIIPVVRETELLRQKALLNGHFKNIIPPKL